MDFVNTLIASTGLVLVGASLGATLVYILFDMDDRFPPSGGSPVINVSDLRQRWAG